MKKLLIAVVLGVLLVAALATTALADNGPHGNFTADTDACASCHRAHSAQGSTYLLLESDIYLLCTSCHDGTGAYTNVVDGVYMAAGSVPTWGAPYGTQGEEDAPTFGGGFENAAMATVRTLDNEYELGSVMPVPAPVSSHHDVETGTAGTVWGAGDINTANGTVTYTLECTSCHDPHGKAGRTGGVSTGTPVASFRLLRFNPQGSNGFEVTGTSAAYFVSAGVTQTGTTGGVFIADVTTKWYSINSDATIDPTLVAYRKRTNTPWWSYVNMRGDYAGRSYIEQRPGFNVPAGVAANVGTQVSCSPVGTGVALDTSCDTDGMAAGALWNNSVPMGKLGYWCSTCHDRYLASGAGRTTDSGDAIYKFRHSTTSVSCVNCHNAHGTTALMTTTLAQQATLNTATGLTGNTNLLIMDNRSLCADCHGYDIGWSSSTLITP